MKPFMIGERAAEKECDREVSQYVGGTNILFPPFILSQSTVDTQYSSFPTDFPSSSETPPFFGPSPVDNECVMNEDFAFYQ